MIGRGRDREEDKGREERHRVIWKGGTEWRDKMAERGRVRKAEMRGERKRVKKGRES